MGAGIPTKEGPAPRMASRLISSCTTSHTHKQAAQHLKEDRQMKNLASKFWQRQLSFGQCRQSCILGSVRTSFAQQQPELCREAVMAEHVLPVWHNTFCLSDIAGARGIISGVCPEHIMPRWHSSKQNYILSSSRQINRFHFWKKSYFSVSRLQKLDACLFQSSARRGIKNLHAGAHASAGKRRMINV